MSIPDNLPRGSAARLEAERLIALAADLLDKKQDQIARDHLGLALCALDRRPDVRLRFIGPDLPRD